MSEVTGSKQYRSIVVRDRPARRVLLTTLSIIFVTFVGLSSYWAGGRSIHKEHQQLSADYFETQQQLSDIEAQYQTVSQQLTNSQVGADVDREAVNSLRSVISEHKQTINALNEEITFYKGLMAPTERERGLGIRSWELYPGSDDRRFQFKLVLQQLALKHSVLKGTVKVDIVGKRAGVPETLSLDILSEQVTNQGTKLRFKYFQYVDGELLLPVDFVPERVDIVASATSPKVARVEKHYGWVVQNSGA